MARMVNSGSPDLGLAFRVYGLGIFLRKPVYTHPETVEQTTSCGITPTGRKREGVGYKENCIFRWK